MSVMTIYDGNNYDNHFNNYDNHSMMPLAVSQSLENEHCNTIHNYDHNLGKGGVSQRGEFLEKFQTAFDPPPPLIFGKSYCGFRDKSAYVHYGGTIIYHMIIFPMRCMLYNSSTWYLVE